MVSKKKVKAKSGTIRLLVRITNMELTDPRGLDSSDYVDSGVSYRMRDFNGPYSALKFMREFLKVGKPSRAPGRGDIIQVIQDRPDRLTLNCLILQLPRDNRLAPSMDGILGYHPDYPYILHSCKFD